MILKYKISNAKYNQYVKELCKNVGIDTAIKIVRYSGKRRIETTLPKYELVTSHTARRTFITISLKRGIIPKLVMKISGHRSKNAFQKYIKLTQNEAFDAMKEAWK